jgi:hypothetical protein
VTGLGLLYRGPGILGVCGSPDHLVSYRFDNGIAVSITMFIIGYCHGFPEISG